jgi:hypothetical protein
VATLQNVMAACGQTKIRKRNPKASKRDGPESWNITGDKR